MTTDSMSAGPSVIHIEGDQLVSVLDERGWARGAWTSDDGAVCAHQAIRLCSPQPGDAHLVEQVAERQGWGTEWNDAYGRTEAEVRDRLARGVDVTDADLADTFGQQWRAVVSLVRRAATLTPDEVVALRTARSAAKAIARYAARYAAGSAAAGSAAEVAGYAAGSAAAGSAAEVAGYAAGSAAAEAAVWAIVTWDLATDDGPYTTAHRDLLIGPWAEVCGMPEGLVS